MPDEPPGEPVALPITGELDLHTFRPGEIAALLDDYFAECRKRGLTRVRVVHGKGTGTLRATVHAHLRRSPGVAGFASGDETSGSWGATLVTLTPAAPGSGDRSSRPTAAGHSAVEVGRTPRNSAGMSTTFLYALVFAVGQILLTLVGFFLGYQTDKINQGSWFGFVPLIYSIIVLSLGIKAVREESEGKYLTYGKGVGTGAMISLYAALIGSIYAYIHFTFVNPSFTDYLIEASRVKWAAAGLGDSQMDAAEKGIRMFTKPAIQAVVGFFMTIIFGVIISLVSAAVLKRNPPEESQVA